MSDWVNVADWPAEARRVAASEPLSYGVETVLRSAEEKVRVYVLTGSRLWAGATEGDQLELVRAFGSNRTVVRVEIVNSQLSDALGQVP